VSSWPAITAGQEHDGQLPAFVTRSVPSFVAAAKQDDSAEREALERFLRVGEEQIEQQQQGEQQQGGRLELDDVLELPDDVLADIIASMEFVLDKEDLFDMAVNSAERKREQRAEERRKRGPSEAAKQRMRVASDRAFERTELKRKREEEKAASAASKQKVAQEKREVEERAKKAREEEKAASAASKQKVAQEKREVEERAKKAREEDIARDKEQETQRVLEAASTLKRASEKTSKKGKGGDQAKKGKGGDQAGGKRRRRNPLPPRGLGTKLQTADYK